MSSCSLRQCIQGALEKHMAQVHVKAFDVSKEDVGYMEIDWSECGEAVFHDICWKAAMDSVKMDNPFSLSQLEKDMLIAAKRTAEYFDSLDKIQTEARRIVEMLKTAKYAIAFTGAGISTAAGIGDFRGRAGKWTEREREKRRGKQRNMTSREFLIESSRPTYTHEAIRVLTDRGYIKHVISQNTDGLHRLSGIPRDKLSELHGNSFHERCDKCGTRYERPYTARRPLKDHRSPTVLAPPRACIHCHFDHSTGAVCERKGCDGALMNCIINFGDSLEKKILSLASEHSSRNDLVLCLGSTLRVAPACDLVEMGKSPVRLVICNRQPTPFDRLCYVSHDDATNRAMLPTADVVRQLSLTAQESSERRDVHSPDVPVGLGGSHSLGAQQRGSCIGSRVFGDCDVLMHEIMSLLLTADELKDWQGKRDARCVEYSRQRRSGVPEETVVEYNSRF